MVFAKNVRATQRIARQFEYRSVTKTYWAIVEGTPESASGEWIDYMRKIPGEAKSEIVDADHDEGKLAVLKYRTLMDFGGQVIAGDSFGNRPNPSNSIAMCVPEFAYRG